MGEFEDRLHKIADENFRRQLEEDPLLRKHLEVARAEGRREGLEETWLAEMIYAHALGCDPSGKTVKANGEPYGPWKKAVDAAAAIRAKIEETRALAEHEEVGR